MHKSILYGLVFLIVLGGCSLFKNTTDKSFIPKMIFIEGGTFIMGDIYGDGNTDAQPAHRVTLSDFNIGKYEVTYLQYDNFAKQTGRPLPKADSLGRGKRAVVNINWKEAQAFCKFHGWRLPTEQEWGYAARGGGQKTRFAGTNHDDSLNTYARTDANSSHFSFRGGTKQPNKTGLYDMSGNVYEWIGPYYQFILKMEQNPSGKTYKNEVSALYGAEASKSPKR